MFHPLRLLMNSALSILSRRGSLLVCAFGCLASYAQPPVVLISAGGTEQLCNSTFFDSGYTSDHGNNENSTITFCPGIAGASMQVLFTTFDLGAGDQLIIYDGNSTAAPIIVTGTLNSLQSMAYVAANATGCLTFQFISDGAGTGAGWSAMVDCNEPCEEPTAVITSLGQDPYKICPGDDVTFDGSGSFAAPGHVLVSYSWDLGGNPFSGASVTNNYPAPGQYPATLTVTDDIGCISVNYAYTNVRVGTIPDLSGTHITPNSICSGETATLNGAVQGTQWTNVPEPFVDGLVQLPDGGGSSYTASVQVSGFPPGTVITSPTDIIDICFVMEHSYFGDLEFVMTCPNGQSVTLFEGYNSGSPGNTYVGGANDTGNGVPGQGAQYCFSNVGTFGTMVNENNNGNYLTAGNPPGNSMIPGNYTSQQSFSNWIGCDLNGTWTITVTDHLFIDDGFIFSWWIDIDPALYPNVVAYTPVYGADCDSTYWSGPDIVSTQVGCDVATVAPSAPGNYNYIYTVTDDFGCTYDTTLTLIVTPGAVVHATATLPAQCGNPVQLGTVLTPPIPNGALVYQWTPSAGLSNANIPSPTASPATATWYHINVFPVGHPLCGSMDSVFVNPITTLEDDSLVVDALCNNDGTGSIQVITTGNGGPWDYSWTDGNGIIVQTTLMALGDTFHGNGGTYSVHVSEGVNGNGCEDSLQATIHEPAAVDLLTLSNDTTICRTGTATLIATAQGGTGGLVAHWNDGITGWARSVMPLNATDYSVWGTDANGCLSDTLDVQVTVLAPLSFTLPDTMVTCPQVDVLLRPDTVSGGDAAYQYDWAGGGFSPVQGHTVNTNTSQQVCLTVRDGCETPTVTHCLWLEVTPIPPLVLSADTTVGCDPFTVRFSVIDTTHAATVDWNFGDGIVHPGPPAIVGHSYTDPGQFDVSVVVHWPNGCDDDTTIANMITVAALPNAEFTWSLDPTDIFAPEVHFDEQAGPFATSWIWDFAGMDTAHGPTPSYVFPNNNGNTYPVQLVVANYLGCTDTVVRNVEVQDVFLVYIPNAFTPDGDGLNEVLYVEGNDIDTKDFDLMIFDRWGEKIHESNDPTQGWDGTIGGTRVQSGVYAWRLRARSRYFNAEHELAGHVTLLR